MHDLEIARTSCRDPWRESYTSLYLKHPNSDDGWHNARRDDRLKVSWDAVACPENPMPGAALCIGRGWPPGESGAGNTQPDAWRGCDEERMRMGVVSRGNLSHWINLVANNSIFATQI